MSCPVSEKAPCCCNCCPCPTPDNVTATFEQLTGAPCCLDGFTVDMTPLDDSIPCTQFWGGDRDLPVCAGGDFVELELRCDGVDGWDLIDLGQVFLGSADLIAASCDPFCIVFETEVDHEKGCDDVDNVGGPYNFRITIRDASS